MIQQIENSKTVKDAVNKLLDYADCKMQKQTLKLMFTGLVRSEIFEEIVGEEREQITWYYHELLEFFDTLNTQIEKEQKTLHQA